MVRRMSGMSKKTAQEELSKLTIARYTFQPDYIAASL